MAWMAAIGGVVASAFGATAISVGVASIVGGLVVGAAGGATIPAQVIRAVIGVIDWDLSAQDALGLPVIFAPGTETVFVEKGSWLESMIPALKALGHAEVQSRALPLKANAIELRGSQAWGAADPRSEGKPAAE